MDSEFITLFNERDEQAFKVVFNDLYPKWLRWVEIRVGNRADAEDIVMPVFFGLWKGEAKFIEYQGVDAYLFYSVKNRFINYIKLKIGIDNIDEFYHLAQEEKEPQSDISILFRKLINKLPVIYKNVLLLEIEGYNGIEIAKIEGTTADIIYKRRWMAIHKLKLLLSEILKTQ